MAGARTGGVGKGVRWGAFANIAALLSDAGAAQGRGSAALGAGIGGGIGQAFANKRSLDLEGRARAEREANRAEDLSEREAVRKEAEFARTEERIYRANRDEVSDSRYTEALKYQAGRDAASDANVKADNERAKATADATLQQGAAAVARLAAEQSMSALSRAGEVLERKMKARGAAMLPPDPNDLQEYDRIKQALMGQAGAKEQAAKFLMQFSPAMSPRAQAPGAAPQAQAPATALPASGPGSVRPGPKGAVLGSEGGKRWMDRLVEAGRDPQVEALTAYEKDLKDYRASAAKAEADAKAALANPKGWSDREKKAAAYKNAQREATLADTTAAKFIGIAGKARAEAETLAANKKKAEAADAAVAAYNAAPGLDAIDPDLRDQGRAYARAEGAEAAMTRVQQAMGRRQKAIEDAKAAANGKMTDAESGQMITLLNGLLDEPTAAPDQAVIMDPYSKRVLVEALNHNRADARVRLRIMTHMDKKFPGWRDGGAAQAPPSAPQAAKSALSAWLRANPGASEADKQAAAARIKGGG